MNEDIINNPEKVTLKNKFINFYNRNKKIIYFALSFLLIIVLAMVIYSEIKTRKEISMSELYVDAKMHIKNDENDKALKILNNLITSNHSTYSVLSLFIIINENLIDDDIKIISMFNELIERGDLEEEIKNLLIFKKALIQSDTVEESTLLNTLKPLINKETVWKPHALLLIGDYFVYKKQYLKARDFYTKILSLINIDSEFHKQARSRLALIINE